MNDIKKRIDEIEAGGVDEQKKLLELEAAALASEMRVCRYLPTTRL